jgi:hypothetical protein
MQRQSTCQEAERLVPEQAPHSLEPRGYDALPLERAPRGKTETEMN